MSPRKTRTTGRADRAAADSPSPEPSAESGESSLLSRFVAVAAGALFAARFLMPAESTADGATLWMVQLWLGLVLLWGYDRFREGLRLVRWSWFDVAVGVMVLGHVISAVGVAFGGGNVRTASTLAWEWVGLAAMVFVFRQVIRNRNQAARILMGLVALSTVLAGFGIWQHYVWYPERRAVYLEIRTELDAIEQGEASPDPRRQAELQQQLLAEGIPGEALSGAGRELFENRLLASSEPIGFFALANSFAGVLAVGLLLAISGLFRRLLDERGTHVPRSWLIACGLAVMLTAYALLLTKSRTAWAGTLSGLCVWAIIQLRTGGLLGRKPLRWLLGGAGVLVAIVGLALATGGLDRQVLTEAKKSLGYRWQYWTGSLAVLREHPVLGPGPGNFRQHYLHHKAAEASEEILDPHNLLLDLWVSGGLLALVGFAAAAVLVAMAVGRRGRETSDESSTTVPDDHPMARGLGWGFALAFVAGGFFGRGWDPALFVLGLCWLGLMVMTAKDARGSMFTGGGLAGALVALCVHLLGAGGIEMPAIVQILCLGGVLSVLLPGEKEVDGGVVSVRSTEAGQGVPLVMGAFGLLFVLCLVQATVPVVNRRALIDQADEAWQLRGSVQQARHLYQEAARTDSLSPLPWRRLGALEFQQWATNPRVEVDAFNAALTALETARTLDPENYVDDAERSTMLMRRYLLEGKRADAAAAAEAALRAVEQYPNQSRLRHEAAVALAAAGESEEARGMAERALALDAINRQQGHRDRYLKDAQVTELKKLAGGRE